MSPTRRDFLKTTGTAAAAASLGVATPGVVQAQAQMPPAGRKRRYAIIGTGVRGIGMWGRPLLQRYADHVEFVGLCDINPKRAELAKQALGVSCPTCTSIRYCSGTAAGYPPSCCADSHSQKRVRALSGAQCREPTACSIAC